MLLLVAAAAWLGACVPAETCISLTYGYQGQATGWLYFKGEASDGSTWSQAFPPETAKAALQGEGGRLSCSQPPKAVVWHGTAWIDTAGESSACADDPMSAQCAPAPSHPQGNCSVTTTDQPGTFGLHCQLKDPS